MENVNSFFSTICTDYLLKIPPVLHTLHASLWETPNSFSSKSKIVVAIREVLLNGLREKVERRWGWVDKQMNE